MAEASVVASASSTGADEGLVLVLDASSPNLAPPTGRRGKKNLPKEAYDILKDYFFNVNKFPNKHDRLELAAKVNSVPGCEAYTQKNVENYFVNLRKRHRQTSTVVVKRELVEEPLFLGADDNAKNGAIVGDDATSVSTAPKKKRESQVKGPGESLTTTSAPAAQHALSTASTEPSISNVRLASTSAPSGPAAPAHQRRWTRLRPEGYKVLSDFFTNVSRYPTAAQKAELLAVVTSMKGCEGYTLQKLTAYFSRLRIERKEPVAFVKAESPDSLSNAAYFPDQEPARKLVLVLRPAPEPEPLPPQPFLVLQPEPAPPKPFLALRPAFEPEPAPEPEPLLATTHSSPTFHIIQSAPQPPTSTPLAASESHFSVFSIFEPVAPVELQVDHRTAGPGLTTSTAAGDGTVEHYPPRHPPKTFVFHPSSLVSSGPAPDPSHAPATQTHNAAEVEVSLSAVSSPSDPILAPIPTPSPIPKSKLKLKLKAKPEPESEPPQCALSDAALKVLDDYYTAVTTSPSTSQCATLANQASALPNGGRCTTKQVRKYFKRRRVEALKAERMGVGLGTDSDSPAPALIAVGEKSDGSVQETSNVETGASELPEAVASSLSPAASGGDQQDGELAVPDVPVGGVPEQLEPEDVMPCSPRGRPSQGGECPDDPTPISGEEERADTGIEADVGRAEPDPGTGAEVEPNSISTLDDTLRGVSVSDALDDPPTPSPLASSGEGRGDHVNEAAPDVSIVDVPGNHGPDGIVPVPVPTSPGAHHDGECLDDFAQMSGPLEEAPIEADVEHAEPDVELGAEVGCEPNLNNMKSYEAVCEVAADAVLADPVDLSALSAPPSGGMHEGNSGDQRISDIAMDSLHEDPEDMVPEDVWPGDVLLLDYPQPDPDDTPMDVDSGTSPTSIQAEVFSLAMQLQRVFSKPSSLDDGHPTTFADFATWLQTRNAGLLCASN